MTENIINEFFIIEWGNINYECGRAQTIKWRDEKKEVLFSMPVEANRAHVERV